VVVFIKDKSSAVESSAAEAIIPRLEAATHAQTKALAQTFDRASKWINGLIILRTVNNHYFSYQMASVMDLWSGYAS